MNEIAQGNGDGGSIAVTWTKPKTKLEARNAAAQARSFACAAAIVLAADVFDSYLRDVATESWLGFSTETSDIATKAITRPGGIAYSVAERALALADELNQFDKLPVALIDLFAKWRNVVAHGMDRSPSLHPDFRQELLGAENEINKSFSHLSIKLAIQNFEARLMPAPKEATSLIANAVRFAKSIDRGAIHRAAGTEERVEAAVEAMLHAYFQGCGALVARSWIADAWQGSEVRRANALTKLLGSLGISESSKPESALLPADFVKRLASLDRNQFGKKYIIG